MLRAFRSSVVLTLWNEERAFGSTGTRQTVQMCRRFEKSLYIRKYLVQGSGREKFSSNLNENNAQFVEGGLGEEKTAVFETRRVETCHCLYTVTL